MGGKAFNHLNIVRMNKDNYVKTKSKLIKTLKVLLKSDLIQDLPYYKDKETFGDLDLVMTNEDLNNFKEKNDRSFFDYLKEKYKKSEYVENGNITSFALPINDEEYVQVDFMPHNREDYFNVINYFSFNDLPILINKFLSIPTFDAVYHMNGCSINIYREEGNTEYLLGIASTNNKMFEYLSALDLNVEHYNKGFSNKKDIYEFIYSSRYFDTDYFFNEIESLNSVEKKRQERSLYQGFIDYVRSKPRKVGDKIKNKEERLFQVFPELKEQKEFFKQEYRNYLKFRERFNGKNISLILSLNEKDRNLGLIMKSFLEERVLSENRKLINKVNSLSDLEFKNMLLQRKKEVLNEKNANFKSKNRIF